MAQAVSRRPLTKVAWVHALSPMASVVDKVALGQVFLRVFQFSPVSNIPLWAPHSQKFKNIVFSFIHPFTHPHPGMNNRPVKASTVQ
jgi:hypothetical protein